MTHLHIIQLLQTKYISFWICGYLLTHIHQSWVECIVQSITDQVKAQDSQHDSNARDEDKVGSVKDAVTFLAQHQAPFWSGRRRTETKEGKSRGRKDGGGYPQRCLNDKGRDGVR